MSKQKKHSIGLFLRIFGDQGFEAWRLDSILEAHQDGFPHTGVSPTGKDAFIMSRVMRKLVEDKYLTPTGTDHIITAEGVMHLNHGGYKKEFVYKRLTRLSVWLSIFATIVSITAFFIAIN